MIDMKTVWSAAFCPDIYMHFKFSALWELKKRKKLPDIIRSILDVVWIIHYGLNE